MPTINNPFSLTATVADRLRESGMIIDGIGQGPDAVGCFSVNSDNAVETLDYVFGFLWPIKGRRRDHLASLWFDNAARRAQRQSRWVFDVFGAVNVDRIYLLACQLEKEFCVTVHVELSSDCRRYEDAPIDYMN